MVEFKETGLTTTCSAIARLTTLEELDFSRNPFGELNNSNIQEMISDLTALRTLLIARSGVLINSVIPILSALK